MSGNETPKWFHDAEEAKKNISKWRSEIIEKMIEIEVIIGLIIMHHYLKQYNHDFGVEVLDAPEFSLNFKLQILRKIVKPEDQSTKKTFEDLRTLIGIRNTFAHQDPTYTVISETYKTFDFRAPNPRKLGKTISFNEKYDEFRQKYDGVYSFISEFLDGLMLEQRNDV